MQPSPRLSFEEWADRIKQGNFGIAIVRWSSRIKERFLIYK